MVSALLIIKDQGKNLQCLIRVVTFFDQGTVMHKRIRENDLCAISFEPDCNWWNKAWNKQHPKGYVCKWAFCEQVHQTGQLETKKL